MGRLLEDQLDPDLVLKRDLAYTTFEGDAKPLKARKSRGHLATHIFIPDTQVKPGVDIRHLDWIGSYIADSIGDRENVKMVVAGDWWDMPSLSSYDVGTARMEGRRVAEDIAAGNYAFARFDGLIPKKRSWEYHFLFGNHEERVQRAVNANAQLDGLLSLALLDTKQWQRHDFLDVVEIDGVWYSHFFANPMTGRPYGGQNVETRLKTIGHSFTMGHQQTYMYGLRFVGSQSQHGLVAGACYLHDEDYKGPQGNAHWRGIIVKNEVADGSYSIVEVTLDFLCRRYEGIRLSEYLEKTAA